MYNNMGKHGIIWKYYSCTWVIDASIYKKKNMISIFFLEHMNYKKEFVA